MIANNPGAHNSFLRGWDLSNYWRSGQFSTDVNNGTYKNIFPGDFISIDVTLDGTTRNIEFFVAHISYYGTGVVMFPAVNIVTQAMNATTTTAGGYIGSRYYTTTNPKIETAIKNAFGSTHVQPISVYYPNAFETGTGKATGWDLYSVYCTLPTEGQVFGSPIWSANSEWEMGVEATQLAIFRHDIRKAASMWLRNVSKVNGHFCLCGSSNHADSYISSYNAGIRPLFCIK